MDGVYKIGGFHTESVKTANLICENRHSQIGGFNTGSVKTANLICENRHSQIGGFHIIRTYLVPKVNDKFGKLFDIDDVFSFIRICSNYFRAPCNLQWLLGLLRLLVSCQVP